MTPGFKVYLFILYTVNILPTYTHFIKQNFTNTGVNFKFQLEIQVALERAW